MALKHTEAVTIRKALHAELGAMQKRQRRGFVEKIMSVPAVGDEEAQFRRTLARILYVREGMPRTFVDGQRLIETAMAHLEELSNENRLFKGFLRDTQVIFGNHCAAFERNDEAIDWYEAALDGEHDLDRRALGYINIARAYLRMRDFHGALTAAQRIDPAKLTDPRLAAHFAFIRAKILLLLGFEEAAMEALRSPPHVRASDPKAQRDRRYLTLLAGLDLHNAQDIGAQYMTLVKGLRQDGLDEDADFYELEGLAFVSLAPMRSQRGTRPVPLARVRKLAATTRQKPFGRLIERIVAYSQGKQDEQQDFAQISRHFRDLSGGSGAHISQMLALIWCLRLVERQHYQRAALVLTKVRLLWAEIESTFPERSRKTLVQQTSRVRALADALESRIPARDRASSDRAVSLLLAGRGPN